jgi:hypothetical protein
LIAIDAPAMSANSRLNIWPLIITNGGSLRNKKLIHRDDVKYFGKAISENLENQRIPR